MVESKLAEKPLAEEAFVEENRVEEDRVEDALVEDALEKINCLWQIICYRPRPQNSFQGYIKMNLKK